MLPGLLQADKAVKCSIKTLDACHKIGCSKPGSPLAVTNSQKRTTAINGSPAKLTFEDLKALQADVDRTFANGPVVIKGQKVSSAHNMKAAHKENHSLGIDGSKWDFQRRRLCRARRIYRRDQTAASSQYRRDRKLRSHRQGQQRLPHQHHALKE